MAVRAIALLIGHSSTVDADKAEEFVPRLLLSLEASKDTARDGGARRLLYAPHDHAQVARLHDNGHPLRLQDFHNGVGNLPGEAFLDL